MTDHSGIPHDLPEYEPNWPAPIKVRAKVFRGRYGWLWAHDCPRMRGVVFCVKSDWPAAFAAALHHARGCW